MFHSFIDEYGHRSNTREILFPRWREDQGYVLGVVKTLSSSDLDLKHKELESREHRMKTEKEVYAKIKKTRGGFLKARLFKIVLNLAQTYLIFRENQRFYLDHLLFRQRLMLLEMGRRLAETAIIDLTDDVFFLFEKELFKIFSNQKNVLNNKKSFVDVKDSISMRKKEFFRYKSTLPPKFVKNGIEFDDTILEHHQNSVYGAAASPGMYSGIARVVEDIKDLSNLKDNEILITSNTDPAWTAVFSKIGGLVTETGGILSHGAVISREYRIPAVTAVKGATEIFKTGEKLLLDGNQGVVHREDD
jgi:pyruvate,water dikinase